jgi:hypothetical protein
MKKMTTNSFDPITRTKADREADQKTLHALIQLAAGVELFTIPLYMTSLYSIAGIKTQIDGSAVPFIGPNEAYTLQGKSSQKAYNAIYSIYIQEMLHLQLALNIGNVLGAPANLTQPVYPPNANDPNWIPCLGKLAHLNPGKYKQFADIKATLGPLDENAINLFLAIELPDDDSLVEPPKIPLTCSPDDVANQTFGGIGNLYHIIEQYMDFVYTDDNDTTLFEYCYRQALAKAQHSATRKITQVNQFSGSSSYSHMTLQVTDGATATLALGQVKDMINGIISEGEGSKKTNFNFVSPNYRPDSDSSEIPADALWGAYSHFARFEYVQSIYKDVVTWPKWFKTRPDKEPWTWQDLVADPLAVTASQKTRAKAQAKAWNSPEIGGQLNDILNSTFNLFLESINNAWSAAPQPFPMAAMRAISSRVTAVWAGRAVPEFIKPGATPPSVALHSCQGLNTATENGKAPGECDCSTAIPHTCAGTNSCKGQGGCGYAVDNSGSPDYYAIQGSDLNYIPSMNDCETKGGCGAPIPVAQVFTEQYSATENGPLNNKSVWQHARELFLQKHKITPGKELQPSPVRTILPPS